MKRPFAFLSLILAAMVALVLGACSNEPDFPPTEVNDDATIETLEDPTGATNTDEGYDDEYPEY